MTKVQALQLKIGDLVTESVTWARRSHFVTNHDSSAKLGIVTNVRVFRDKNKKQVDVIFVCSDGRAEIQSYTLQKLMRQFDVVGIS